MTNLNQLLLNFEYKQNFKDQDFYVSKSNYFAFNLISTWPKWEKNFLNICGDNFSGKSHLANIFLKKFKGIKINAHSFKNEHLNEIKVYENIVLENFDLNINEVLIYSLFNTVDQDNKYLIINSKNPISSYKFKLPDLISRINSSLMIGIKLPNDELISAIIAKNFSDKQINVEEKHIDYIIKRIDRSYEKISQFILTLDKYSLEKGSPFSLKMIKEVIKMI